jgi:very-short-patch-repair endonuclease
MAKSHNDKLQSSLSLTRKHEFDHKRLKTLLKYAKINRSRLTWHEKRFNGWLSTWGLKHTNQAVFVPYIADVLLTDYPVIFELDGSQHEFNKAYDEKRDAFLRMLGYKIIRINNTELSDMQNVKRRVFEALEDKQLILSH